MFKGCSSLESLDVSNFITKLVSDMREMFNSINKLKVLNLTSFYTVNLYNYNDIFGGNDNLEIILNKNNNPNIILNLPNGVTITDINNQI